MKVSIILPVYNCEKLVARCINSLLKQEIKDKEIICVDDHSTDNSLKVLKSFFKQMKRNGQGKGTLLKKHGRKLMKKIDYLVITFPLITILLLLMSFFNFIFFWLWLSFLAVYLFIQPLFVYIKTRKKEVIYLPLIQLVRLIAFEIGFWRGFLE